MAKKARQRISYILEPPNASPGGHKLGVNGLAVDADRSILYSGGRDGIVCAWDLHLDLEPGTAQNGADVRSGAAKSKETTQFRAQTIAHTHWINDIVLAQKHAALVSASSDLTVKVWRPLADSASEPVTVGQHADYVKCLATPAPGLEDWVASGGLDRKIYLWDLNGKGKSLEIDVKGEEITEKGSVYALTVNQQILACGGPESTVRLYDPKTGKRITKFVGHTDNIRSILMNAAGDTLITASSDQTVKVWSVTAGRCMQTLTMHNDSVWSLYSDDPDLGVFYSSDRSGLVVKTDVRGAEGEWDDGLCVALAHEHDGVSKIVASGGYLWTATASSSINRWADIDVGKQFHVPEPLQQKRAQHRASIVSTEFQEEPAVTAINGRATKDLPLSSILRISNTASFPLHADSNQDDSAPNPTGLSRKDSAILAEPFLQAAEPIHQLPEETIEGQFGLVKHRLLNDRRRVLTLDTSGDVLLWDLIQCKPIQSFGKKHLEDVEPEINTIEAVAPWCSIDISSGNLTVVLEPFNCFDAEMYADELPPEEISEFRDDQRINLGKWILRYLFTKLIDEEIKRDEAHRQKLNAAAEKQGSTARAAPPTSIAIAPPTLVKWDTDDASAITPKANGAQYAPTTPGLGIGVASPGPAPLLLGGATTPASPSDKRQSGLGTQSTEKEDYFANAIGIIDAPPAMKAPVVDSPADTGKATAENGKGKDKDKENAKSPGSPAVKKSRWGFGSKKLGRSTSSSQPEKPAVVEEKIEESEAEASSNHEKEVDDSFLGVIQKIHNEYEKQVSEDPSKIVETKITPSLPNDTPTLKLPAATQVIIQEETSGGSAELYRGTVETVGNDADLIEQKAPMWLGDVLLTNTTPPKDPVKVSFVLHPWKDTLPPLASPDGNNRLNANRMLRVKKILAYVAERIDPPEDPENPDPNALKPEEYLELYCNEQLLPITMTLATLRAHIWKGGNDVVLHYKANGRKEIPIPKPVEPVAEAEAAPAAGETAPAVPAAP